ncbi:MAG: hypothetical protein FIA93_01310 [Deltaproteobacteria bacterium]|nr:hypothetical protein [Deltaproteobacteria bacterium]
MKSMLFVMVLLALLSAPASCPAAAAQETVGVVRNATGAATGNRGGQVIPAAVGMNVREGDTLGTGLDGSMGIIFRDNSTLSLGPDSSLVIRGFLFSPAEGKFGLWVRISRGTMAYLSGLIGKLAPASARFETPVASIGIRGTRFAVKVEE